MRNLPIIITAVIVMSIMLTAALLSRTYRVGPSRSVQFGNELVVNVDAVDSVAVLIEAPQADGTSKPIAWAYLGPVQGSCQVNVTLPTVPLVVTCVTGSYVVQKVNGADTVLGSGDSLVAGGAPPGIALPTRPGSSPGNPWISTIMPAQGVTWVLRLARDGVSISSQPASSMPPVPPPPPAAQPASAVPPPQADATDGGA